MSVPGGFKLTNQENIWREQCEATHTIKQRFGEQAAFDYLVGEKLLHFVSAARQHPEFASQLPAFVAQVRLMFSPAEMITYLDRLQSQLESRAHEFDEDDMQWLSTNTADWESFVQIAPMLRAPALGTA